MAGKIKGVSEVALWVKDLEAAKQFYIDILGCEIVEEDAGHNVFLSAGDCLIVLFQRDSPNTALANEYLARTGGPKGEVYHIALRVEPDELDGLASEIRSHNKFVKGPVEFAGGRRSYFLEDTDEHYLELTDR